MNDGDYPRRQTAVDFDLMAQPGQSRPGDRSRREDDRYLFLEALLSARDALHISWVGRSARDNSLLPPSVLVGQLRDYLAAGWHRADAAPAAPDAGQRLLAALTTDYPLQPFSRRYFEAGHDPRVFTYAREWQQAHRANASMMTPVPLPPWVPDTALTLGQLQRFLARPVATFFNQRLKVYFSENENDALDHEPFALDGLQRYAAMQQVVHAVIDTEGVGLGPAVAGAVRRLADEGQLPPGGFGGALQEQLAQQAQGLTAQWQAACQRWLPHPDKFELRHRLDEMLVEDWLVDLRQDAGGQQRRLELVTGNLLDKSGQLRFEKLTHAWVIHLLANANQLPMRTQLIGPDAQPTFDALPPSRAAALLDELLQAWRAAMDTPLPIARRSAFAWLASLDGKRDPAAVARECYEGNSFSGVPGEGSQDAYLAVAWPDFSALLQAGFETWLHLYRPLTEALLPTEDAA
jgi:exodeoxyribonuclease V gamma subunit